MNLLGLITRELARRAKPSGWTRVIVETDEDQANLDAALAEGHIREPIIIRRIVAPAPRN